MFQTQAAYDKQRKQCILPPFGSTATSVGHEVFLLTFTEPNIALCQYERQSKRQAGEAVIQSEVLRISPGSSSFSNYPPDGILAVLDNNGSLGARLSPLKCGWRKPARGAGQRNVCFSVMSSEDHKSKANLHYSPSADEDAQRHRSHMLHTT